MFVFQRKIILFFVLSVALASCNIENAGKDGSNIYEIKADSVLSLMNLDEKIGQMTQITINYMLEKKEDGKPVLPFRLVPDSVKSVVTQHLSGSVFGCARRAFTLKQWRQFVKEIQTATKNTRLKIPVIYGVDAIHGTTFTAGAVLYPQEIGQAATWNPQLVEKIGEATAYDCRATGVPWNFSPVLGLGRNPLWSRFFETYGEDELLTETMGTAIINGYQGNDEKIDGKHVAACMKHYLGYSFPLSGKDRTQAWIPELMLREYFLPPFRKAVESGALSLMVNSGEVNGTPLHASHYWLTDVLRDELGFKGVVVTDFMDIILLHKNHHIASSYKEAVEKAINAGVDMSMVPADFHFQRYLKELVNEGKVPVSRIDESVKRILTLKFKLGLFEKPVPDFDNYADYNSRKHMELGRKAAEESITLLKNENGILPLKENMKVLVCGPTADSLKYLNGPWSFSWQGKKEEYYPQRKNTIREAMEIVGGQNVAYCQAADLDGLTDIDKAVSKAAMSDVIVACVGEEHSVEELGNINEYRLPGKQYEMVKRLAATGKPLVLVITAGRPEIITAVEPLCDAVIMCYLPGTEGGDALARIVYGKVNPSGKLPFTWPAFPATISTYDHKYTDENIDGKQAPYQPLYEFGYGLSYTDFEYINPEINDSLFSPDDTIYVKITVKNTGKMPGKEVVQLYASDLYASVTPPVKRLRAFDKISLLPDEEKTVKFRLPVRNLGFIGNDLVEVVEPGVFVLQIGKFRKSIRVTE